MKCPFRTKIVYKPKETFLDGTIKKYQEDVTEFCDCYERECPYFLKMTTQECSKVKGEK